MEKEPIEPFDYEVAKQKRQMDSYIKIIELIQADDITDRMEVLLKIRGRKKL